MRQTSNGHTETLRKFASDMRYSDIPAQTIQKTKTIIPDTIGMMVGACKSDSARIMTELARDLGGGPECTVVGAGVRSNVLNAALANGNLGHEMEPDDIHTPSNCHAAAAVSKLLDLSQTRFA